MRSSIVMTRGSFWWIWLRGEYKVDLVIMDPPRSGSTEEFMESVARMGVEKVVYVSCNPETLGRDLRVMKKLGYGAVEGWGVDMFADEAC